MTEQGNRPDAVRVKRLNAGAELPKRQTTGSAGYDLRACIEEKVTIEPGGQALFPTGLAVEIPQGFVGLIYTRSGLGIKHGIAVANGVGVIDSDYRGELHVGLRNFGGKPYTIEPGERIAQLIFQPVYLPRLEEAEELSETGRDQGGFGSTGTQ